MSSRPSHRKRSFIPAIEENSYDRILSLSIAIYGITVLKLTRSSKSNPRRFYIQEGDRNILQWVSPKKSASRSFIILTMVHKIEIGGTSPKFQKYKNSYERELAVSLYHQGSLDLIFQDVESMHLWLAGIQYLIKEATSNSSTDISVHRAFSKADTNNSGSLNLQEVKKLMKDLNIFIEDERAQQIFNEFDRDNSGTIDRREFEKLVDRIMEKPEINEIFLKASHGKDSLDFQEFSEFCASQGEESSEEVFCNFCDSLEGTMNLETFKSFLLNPQYNSILSLKEEKVHMDMTYSLAHYFIASSHNTYLEGNQLTGTSSIDQYTKVLLEGCRCVEIDTWDGDDGEPVVTHGHTLVNKISLHSVAQEIFKMAFVASKFPVIISLENHCSYDQTGKIGEIFKQVFKNSIYVPSETLLTPEDLSLKFIIKAKAEGHKKTELSIHKSLLSITGMNGMQFSFNLAFNSMVSLSESKMLKMISQHGSSKIIGFNQKSFMRIYPKATRIDSSNYNPVPSWCHGAQVVAINYQYFDLGRLLNSALFACNGRAGYILKPRGLRDHKRTNDYSSDRFSVPKVRLVFEIISACNLPKVDGSDDILCPQVQISSFGIENDFSQVETRIVDKNGFNPVWKERIFIDFRYPEFAFVVFSVLHRKELVCYNAIFLPAIANGYRVVQMLDKKLDVVEGCHLFVKVETLREFEI
jgi:Ca2+-binding EF-hand superfamily protein